MGPTAPGQPDPGPPGAPLGVLLVIAGHKLREEMSRTLAGPERGLRLLAVASFAEARPFLEAREVDALVLDLVAWAALREADAAGYDEARRVPLLILVPPGAEEQLLPLLEQEAAEFLFQAGNYLVLLPALLRRARRRHETSWEEVARVVRHEMNNPLTGILGNAELILAEKAALPGKVPERLATIIHLAVRLRDVVRGLEKRLRREENDPDGSLPPGNPHPVRLTGEVLR